MRALDTRTGDTRVGDNLFLAGLDCPVSLRDNSHSLDASRPLTLPHGRTVPSEPRV